MRFYFTSLLVLCVLLVHAQGEDNTPKVTIKQYTAVRTESEPTIDGRLDDEAWKMANIATDFVQNSPNPGKLPAQKTEVRVLYDNTAIYIGAVMYDVANDSILRQYSNRDEEDNTDIFAVFIDTYNDDQNAFGFVVHPTGVQWDARYSAGGEQDISWNAVWKSEVHIDDKNWYAEIKIPYSAIRFSNAEEQTWGINFGRKIRRLRQFNFWNPVDPKIDGFVNQFGDMDGISNIEAPVRLSFTPYVSAYLEHYPFNEAGKSNYSSSFNGGMDVKYGISDAFTLDMTLVPDFGQVQSDNQVLNLSPFEVRFNENRQFFTEGTELFSKADALFYTRRIGGRPIDYGAAYANLDDDEEVVDNPAQSRLYNATKVTGRTPKGLGIGVFNGLTRNMYATIRNASGNERTVLTDPLTNYNVLVVDQALRNNSYISFINTNVMRAGHYYDANANGVKARLANKKNTYAVSAGGNLTQQIGLPEDEEGNTTNIGHSYFARFSKIGGNFTFDISHGVESDTYNPNDLGFLYNNNEKSYNLSLRHNTFEPSGAFVNTWKSFDVYYGELYSPNKFSDLGIGIDVGGTFTNFLSAGMFTWLEPIETYDYFEPRVWGRHYTWQPSWNVGGFLSSDYRKQLAIDFNANFRKFAAEGRHRFNMSVGPRWRASDRLSFYLGINRFNFVNDEGAAISNETGGGTIIDDDIIFAKRHQLTYENVFTANYIFTNRMGLSFRLRHYWSTVDYQSFHVLDEDGYLVYSDYEGLDADGNSLHNNSFDAFNIDMVYTWVFAPGSEMNVVWKNAIYRSENDLESNYINNLQSTLDAPQINSISMKILYFVDYLSLKKKRN